MPSFKEKLLLKLLERIQFGSMHITLPSGAEHQFQGKNAGPHAHIVLHSPEVVEALFSEGDIGFAECYMEGKWDSDDLCALMSFVCLNVEALERVFHAVHFFGALNRLLHLRRKNTKQGSRKNIHAHYDLGNDFYRLWLDDSMTYSSALYAPGAASLEAAQAAKYQRILSQLSPQGGERVLEVGCGWGGFAEAAHGMGAAVTGLTLSPAQAEYARARLSGTPADIAIRDYRDEQGLYDHIVSIEMFEAVGERYWPDYFRMLRERLRRGGKAVIQTITIADQVFPHYRKRADFIQRHIFPGGMLPSGAVFLEGARAAGLKCEDAFAFGKDYARTLSEWFRRFEANAVHVGEMGFSPEFIRKWKFYLAYCYGGFDSGRTNVFQYSLKHVA